MLAAHMEMTGTLSADDFEMMSIFQNSMSIDFGIEIDVVNRRNRPVVTHFIKQKTKSILRI